MEWYCWIGLGWLALVALSAMFLIPLIAHAPTTDSEGYVIDKDGNRTGERIG
jgi:hypothetical protein